MNAWTKLGSTAMPGDVGMAWAIGKAKRDFVGKRSLARPAMLSPTRKQLVGLLTEDPGLVLDDGAQILASPDQGPSAKPLGHVTSSYFSATLNRSIALAMLAGVSLRRQSASIATGFPL